MFPLEHSLKTFTSKVIACRGEATVNPLFEFISNSKISAFGESITLFKLYLSKLKAYEYFFIKFFSWGNYV